MRRQAYIVSILALFAIACSSTASIVADDLDNAAGQKTPLERANGTDKAIDNASSAPEALLPLAAGASPSKTLSMEDAALRREILMSARSLLGNKPYTKVQVRGKTFTLDCVGTVKAAWWGAGVALDGDPGRFGGNGVAILWRNAEAFGEVLKDASQAAPGDLVFWDNTWDKNGNGVFGDDPLTHVGIVLARNEDGLVEYLHLDYAKGVVAEIMNTDRPSEYKDASGRRTNSAMYMASYPGSPKNPPLWTAGELFRGYADADELAGRWPQ